MSEKCYEVEVKFSTYVWAESEEEAMESERVWDTPNIIHIIAKEVES